MMIEFNENDLVNKKEIVDRMYEIAKGRLLKKDLRVMVDIYGKAIVSLLEEGKVIKCRNMGTFYLKKYVNRKGRNPVTGEMFTIEPYFRPMLKFPDAVYHEFRERERKGDSE